MPRRVPLEREISGGCVIIIWLCIILHCKLTFVILPDAVLLARPRPVINAHIKGISFKTRIVQGVSHRCVSKGHVHTGKHLLVFVVQVVIDRARSPLWYAARGCG